MSRTAASDAPDRVRFPFVTPTERAEMQAALKREQSADPFDNRAPLALEAGDGTGLLGVPRRDATPQPPRREPRIRMSASARSVSVPLEASFSDRPAVDGAQAVPAKIAEPTVAQPAEAPVPESEEIRSIKHWLAEEMGRIENVLVSHLGRAEEPPPAAPEIAPSTATDAPASAMHAGAQPEAAPSDLEPQPMYRHPSRLSEPVDLDEIRDRLLAGLAAPAAEPYDPAARAVPEQFLPKKSRLDGEGGARASGLRLTRPPAAEVGDEDVPEFLRVDPAMERPRRPAVRPDSGYREPPPVRPERMQLDPVPPIRPPRPRGLPQARTAGSQSTWGALILAYAVFILIPVTEWMSGTLDPRIGAVVPAMAFLGWLSIHALRRDQLFQLRILTAWQVAHAAGCLHAIRPWGGSPAAIHWIAASVAVGCALVVVAASAVVETYEYRAARPPGQRLPPSRMPSMGPRDAFRVPAE